jgi:hypothetical protein
MSHFNATRSALNENKLSYDYVTMWLLVQNIICIYIFSYASTHKHTQGVATFNVQDSLHKHEQFTELLMPASASAAVLRNVIYLVTYFKLTLFELFYSLI